MNLQRKHRYLLSILSGVLMAISFPYTGSLTFVAFIAWVPILFVEHNISVKNYKSKKVFTHAYLTFFFYNVLSTWWVWNASIGGAILAILANSLLMAIIFYLFHRTKKWVGTKEGYISLLIYWIAFEQLHFHWELSWTWLTLGNTFSITPWLVQWYSTTGVLGGSLWILAINLLIFRAYSNVYFKKESWKIQTPIFIIAILTFIVPTIISLISYWNYEEKIDPVEVVIVQPNVDPYEKFNIQSEKTQIDKIIDLANSNISNKTDLIIAPETAIAFSVDENNIWTNLWGHPSYGTTNINAFNKKSQIPFCIGASTHKFFDKDNSRASFEYQPGLFLENYNTALFFKEKESYPEIIHKSKLVPGTEIVPFSNYFPYLEQLSIDQGGTSGTLGIEDSPKNFKTKNFNFAPVVCYESIFGNWVREQCFNGAEFITIITNDGWWEDTPGHRQHLSFASLRAIENRRSIARSANTGTSAVINQRGDILQTLGWWKEGVLIAKINKNTELTNYSKYGNFLGRSFVFVSCLLLLLTFVRRIKKTFGND